MQDLTEYGILYYNALFVLAPSLALAYAMDEVERGLASPLWASSAGFVLAFGLSCVLGFALMYSYVLCTKHNSPLTSSVIGVSKARHTHTRTCTCSYTHTAADLSLLSMQYLSPRDTISAFIAN